MGITTSSTASNDFINHHEVHPNHSDADVVTVAPQPLLNYIPNDVTTIVNPELEWAQRDDTAASSYIDILSDDENVTATFLPRSVSTSTGSSTKRWRYSLYGTIFNFINCIVGAGAIGLGGAMAATGGFVSVVIIIFVAVLVKLSLDLIIDLSINHLSNSTTIMSNGNTANPSISYEDLGYAAYGKTGKVLVMVSKFVYAFGCVVAYTIIIHDNFGSAMRHLLSMNNNINGSSFVAFRWLVSIIQHDKWCTWFICTSIILPLCLMRDMSILASTSFISVIAMMSIVGIVVYMWYIDIGHRPTEQNTYITTSSMPVDGSATSSMSIATMTDYLTAIQNSFHVPRIDSSIYRHWLTIRWFGLLNNMGTFVFSFVCHHTVHLTYRSLVPELQNLSTWKFVSTVSLCVACIISLSVAIFCYMTFWGRTVSDIFQIYPDTHLINMAKLLLCVTMILTFPLPFFTCRELFILFCFYNKNNHNENVVETNPTRSNRDPRQGMDGDLFGDLNEPLLDDIHENEQRDVTDTEVNDERNVTSSLLVHTDVHPPLSSIHSDVPTILTRITEAWNSALLPNDDRQLKLTYHIIVTCKLWFIITATALAAPNLGDVLDFVGCCSGTLIAFILPGLFAVRIQGWTVTASIILLAGGFIGIIGTICSSQKLIKDVTW
jgi:amino acid permease